MFAVMGMEGRIEEGLGQPHSGTLSAVIVCCRIVNTWFYNSECVKRRLMLAILDTGTDYGDKQAHGDGNTDCMPERGW